METRIENELNKAAALFYSQKLREAYSIFKRYFDRIPFKAEEGHAKYIGMFVRCLFELGKTREVEFYRGAVERLYEEAHCPLLGYQLAVLHLSPDPKELKKAKEILEHTLTAPEVKEYKNKSKMFLAHCYDVLFKDTASVRKLIDSISGELSPADERLLGTWKAKLARDEGDPKRARGMFEKIIQDVPMEMDWNCHLTARFGIALTFVELEDLENASLQLAKVRELLKKNPWKSIEIRLQYVDREIEKKRSMPSLILKDDGVAYSLMLNGKEFPLFRKKKQNALLIRLLKEGFVSKEAVKKLMKSEDDGKVDDGTVYSNVHTLRKELEKFGLSRDAIQNENGGYRFVPKVEFMREES